MAGTMHPGFACWCAALLLPCLALVAQQPVTVATHYFYWYKWPTEHFDQEGAPGAEGHARHFANPELVDYESAAWHEQNFRAMAACGIDAALPVYWGAPGLYDRPHLRFSRAGIPHMVAALESLRARGERGVKLGLFYDTSTLSNDVRDVEPRGGRADLVLPEGRELFCRTVVEYFAAIPREHWALHRGGALVVLYASGFAARWNPQLGPSLRSAFAAAFDGAGICLVADVSWGNIGQDFTTAWGTALHGPRTFPGTAQLGPGYDDRQVPGRRTPVREREDGRFYDRSWQVVLRTRPELVLLETWNEMHEGTEICSTIELGDRYEEATRKWITRLRSGADPGPSIELQWPEPRYQDDLSWGAEARGRDRVHADFGTDPATCEGLRAIDWEDGRHRVTGGLLGPAAPQPGATQYLYFQVSDHLAFDCDADFELLVTRSTGKPLELHYDSRDRFAPLDGSYRSLPPVALSSDGTWSVDRYVLSRARFANRQNGGSDFRFVAGPGSASIRSVELRRLQRRRP